MYLIASEETDRKAIPAITGRSDRLSWVWVIPELVIAVDRRNVVQAICRKDDSGQWAIIPEPAVEKDTEDDSDNISENTFNKKSLYNKYMRKIVIVPEVMKMQPKEEDSDDKSKDESEKEITPDNSKANQKEEIPTVFLKHLNRNPDNNNVHFKIIGHYKPDYWDMCVADAVCSILYKGRSEIYVKDIWAVLTGNRDIRIPNTDSVIKKAIVDSLNKLMVTKIEISDFRLRGGRISGTFLPLKDHRKGSTCFQYDSKDLPPLFKYAVEIGGEIIRVPVSFFNLSGGHEGVRYKPAPLYSRHTPHTITCDKAYSYYVTDGKKKYGFSSERKLLICSEKEQPYEWVIRTSSANYSIMRRRGRGSYREIEVCRKESAKWQNSREQAVLCHYILHRAFISNRKSRGRYISFDNVFAILGKYITQQRQRDRLLLYRRLLGIFCYYQSIGLIHFVGYITDFIYYDKDGDISSKTVFFRIEHTPGIEFWSEDNTCFYLPKDIHMTWVEPSYNNRNVMIEVNSEEYTEETLSDIRKLELSDLTGVKLLYMKNVRGITKKKKRDLSAKLEKSGNEQQENPVT